MQSKSKLHPRPKSSKTVASELATGPTAEQVAEFAAGAGGIKEPIAEVHTPSKKTAVMCRLPQTIVDAVDRERSNAGISRNALISQILAEWVKVHKKSIP